MESHSNWLNVVQILYDLALDLRHTQHNNPCQLVWQWFVHAVQGNKAWKLRGHHIYNNLQSRLVAMFPIGISSLLGLYIGSCISTQSIFLILLWSPLQGMLGHYHSLGLHYDLAPQACRLEHNSQGILLGVTPPSLGLEHLLGHLCGSQMKQHFQISGPIAIMNSVESRACTAIARVLNRIVRERQLQAQHFLKAGHCDCIPDLTCFKCPTSRNIFYCVTTTSQYKHRQSKRLHEV